MKKMISRFWHDEEGASAVEYALIAALLAIALIAAVEILGTGISGGFTNIAASITGAGGDGDGDG